ncbi:MAG: radical SAM protein, partial [Myxococcota bacterium]
MLRSGAHSELRRRMGRPQRHRLLHGYPMLPVMRSREPCAPFTGPISAGRPLLIGVLPHSFCNPRVRGCGFCTFPHEPFHRTRARAVMSAVVREIAETRARLPILVDKPVSGVYFGGGTANLAPVDAFGELCGALERTFDLAQAEVTLEGVPAYFLIKDSALLKTMRSEIHARHFRISMGVQSFDDRQIAAMGREAFGGVAEIAAVIDRAHNLGMTASMDLLINLPGQSTDQAIRDACTAMASGVDQICIYHLVIYPG